MSNVQIRKSPSFNSSSTSCECSQFNSNSFSWTEREPIPQFRICKIDSVGVSFFLSQAPVSLWERSVLTSATPVFVPVCLCVNNGKGRDTKTPGTPNKWPKWRAHLPALKGQSSLRICLTSTLPKSLLCSICDLAGLRMKRGDRPRVAYNQATARSGNNL